MIKIITSFIVILFITACASKPVLYPNEKYKHVGKDHASLDIDQCSEDADKFIESSKGKKMLKEGGKGALMGGIMGAALGLFTGDIGQAAMAGAAVGGVGGTAGAALSPDQLKRKYVNYCLQKKGYKIIGWD